MPRPPEAEARLRKRLERAIAGGHPWVFRDALHPFRAAPGTVVTVLDGKGRFVARGIADAGPIAVRVFTTRDEPVDADLIGRRIADAAALRDRVVPTDTTAYRLAHGEGDRLPGIVCDVYGDHSVLVLDGEGARAWQATVVETLGGVLRERAIHTLLLRSGRGADRRVETAWGTKPVDALEVRERGAVLLADLVRGQKTGLFLDHRDSRARLRDLARGRRVLDLYGYTGSFSVAAGLGGAESVTTVDSAAAAIDLARRAWIRNGLPARAHVVAARDVREFLEASNRARDRYDLVVADPPSFAPNERSVRRALEAYRALHASVLRLLSPGGLYLAASCSSHVRRAAFEGTLSDAARRVGRSLRILDRWGAPPDHPRLLGFPEGDYLDVVLVSVGE